MKKNIVMSIGGSVLVSQKGIDTTYLKEFNKLVRNKIVRDNNKRLFIITGGGHLAHEYQYAAERIRGQVKNNDRSWLGVHATRLNAHLLRTIFHDVAFYRVIVNYDKLPDFGDSKVVICAAWLPGATTDFDMVNLTKLLGIKEAFSLLNVEGIYDKDPSLFNDAKIVNSMKWEDYREMIGDWWDTKRQIPFDPFASKLAEAYGLKIAFMSGKNIPNIKNALDNRSFVGTVIK